MFKKLLSLIIAGSVFVATAYALQPVTFEDKWETRFVLEDGLIVIATERFARNNADQQWVLVERKVDNTNLTKAEKISELESKKTQIQASADAQKAAIDEDIAEIQAL